MKLSTRARYGLHCMLAVARLSGDDGPASLELVHQRTGISKRYLEQLAIALKHSGLLSSISGRGGGYFLAREASAIRLGEIVEATIGPINIVDCVCDPHQCAKADHCEARLIYMLINRSITAVLNEYSLADLGDADRLAQIVATLEAQGGGAPGVDHTDPEDLCGCSIERVLPGSKESRRDGEQPAR